MDTTKKYIEMCEKAEEIQRQKSWTDADIKDFWEPSEMSEFVWLPRQDQLQGVVPPKSKFHRIVDVLYDFTDWVKVNATYVTSDCSMEQLWLAFLMKEKYKKTWDGEKWTKKG